MERKNYNSNDFKKVLEDLKSQLYYAIINEVENADNKCVYLEYFNNNVPLVVYDYNLIPKKKEISRIEKDYDIFYLTIVAEGGGDTFYKMELNTEEFTADDLTNLLCAIKNSIK